MKHLEHLNAHRTRCDHASERSAGTILLLGEDNPQSDDPRHALFPEPPGCAGNRLQEKIFKVDHALYLAMWRTNLCNPTWELQAARARALVIAPQAATVADAVPWKTIVLLGAKVMRAFAEAHSIPEMPPFAERRWCRAYVETPGNVSVHSEPLIYLPHPSGRSQAWNAPAAVHRARALLAVAAPEIPWGDG